jgi:probable RNA-binding protein EIF1AD
VDQEALNTERDNKLGGMIVGVVVDEKAWRKMSYWPKEFGLRTDEDEDEDDEEEDSNVGKMPPDSDSD